MYNFFRNKLKTYILTLCLCFALLPMYAQYPVNQIGGRAVGMSGASVCIKDIWAQYHNQAALAYLSNIGIGVAFQNSFLIKELSTKSISVAIPLKSFVLGVNYYYFGYTKFNENKLALAFAKKIGKRIALGGQIDYFHTHISRQYENKSAAVGELGIIAEPVNNLLIAAHVFNVWNAKFENSQDEYMPNTMKIGVAYLLQNSSTVSIEAEKSVNEKILIKTGVEIKFLDKFTVRAGVLGKPMAYSFGLGYEYKAFQLNIAFIEHHILGYSPAVSILYTFKNRI